MARTLFQAAGHLLGKKAAQARNAFYLMGGTEEESLRAEIRLGRDMEAAMLDRVPLLEENETTRFAEQTGRWLASHVKERRLPFRVLVTAEQQPNAFALPGGPVFISWPLLVLCEGQRDEIAFVLAHEMAHIVLRHTLERIIKDAAVSLLLRRTSGRHAVGTWLNQVGRQVLESAFSRDDELEADTFAAGLLRRSGGDPLAAERLLERIAGGPHGGNVSIAGEYLASHPTLAERVANLRAKRAG